MMPASNDKITFPLGDWFDLSRPISKDDRQACEAQMPLYAYKKGLGACAHLQTRSRLEERAGGTAHRHRHDGCGASRRPAQIRARYG